MLSKPASRLRLDVALLWFPSKSALRAGSTILVGQGKSWSMSTQGTAHESVRSLFATINHRSGAPSDEPGPLPDHPLAGINRYPADCHIIAISPFSPNRIDDEVARLPYAASSQTMSAGRPEDASIPSSAAIRTRNPRANGIFVMASTAIVPGSRHLRVG